MSTSTTGLWRTADGTAPARGLAGAVEDLVDGDLPFRFTAYDGSAAGSEGERLHVHLASTRGLRYIATCPNSLGFARAYVAGDLVIRGMHPGDPYPILEVAADRLRFRRPTPRVVARIARELGPARLLPPEPPPEEALPDWRRALEGLRHSFTRDARAIEHHYDVSNAFYERVLGPSMTYTCACYPREDASLEEAQAYKYEIVARKLGLQPGMRLLDVGCGWGGMVRHAARMGVKALGVTLSREQAAWAADAIRREGLEELAEIRHLDYRRVREAEFDAVSSIGLTEHIGTANYPAYFGFLFGKLRPGGRMLNHCITRPDTRHPSRVRGGFIDRYVFPDGEITGVGRIVSAMQDAGFEVRHAEDLREHYARTCAAWCENLVATWDDAVAEVGEARAKVWGLYLAGSRLGFERNQIQLHQVLGVKLRPRGVSGVPLRPQWDAVPPEPVGS